MAITAVLFSPLSAASSPASQLHTLLSAQLVRVDDEARVSIRTAPNLLPPCEQPLFSMSNNSRLWGNVNVLACYGNDKRYLQVNVQATGNCVVAVMPIVRGEELEADNVKLKRGRLDTLPPCVMLDISQLIDAASLRGLSSGQLTQLTQFRQVRQVKAGQRVNAIASGYGVSVNAEGWALNNIAVAQNIRVCMVPGQAVNGVIDADGNTLINL